MATVDRGNVQQQNQKAQAQMRMLASQFKTNSADFHWLVDILESGLETRQQGVLVSLKRTPDKGGSICEGMWLSADRRFFEFSVLLPFNGGPPKVEFWNDVSDDIIINAHQPGSGKSFGFLALEVLDESLKR